RRCWGRRWRAGNPDGDRDRGRASARHGSDVRGAQGATGDLLSTAAVPESPPRRRISFRALNEAERAAVLMVLHEPRFVDLPPAEVYATLLDEGRYLCSERTMYRILAAHQEVRERRNQLRHPHYA